MFRNCTSRDDARSARPALNWVRWSAAALALLLAIGLGPGDAPLAMAVAASATLGMLAGAAPRRRAPRQRLPHAPAAPRRLSEQLRGALDRDEIVAFFQPQISCETGHVSGFEALARWSHPSEGLIAPAVFLPVVERQGLSDRLVNCVLSQALDGLRTWDEAGFAVPGVSVNFSALDLCDPDLPDRVRWEIDRHEVPPSRLTVEVLESVIAPSYDDIIARNLRKLASVGCRIDLDDFGTGSSSILNIRRFSVSRIKIDRSLVSNSDTDRDQRDMVAAVLAMAERLGIETLAEGVETPGEAAILSQLGCGHIQGFGVARPLPLAETVPWLAERSGGRRIPSVPLFGPAASHRSAVGS